MCKTLKTLYLLLISLFVLSSCNGVTEIESDEITGSWYGTTTYYNPVGGQKYSYFSIVFNSNHSGSFEYETPSSYSVGYFKYSISGNVIKCVGSRGSTSSALVEDFTLQLRYDKNRLIPINHYSQFILTRDGSIETDSEGNVLTNDVNNLRKVWVRDDGRFVLDFHASDVCEYKISTSDRELFSNMWTYPYSYDYQRKKLYMGVTEYDIVSFSEKQLIIQNQTRTLKFNAGASGDVPKQANIAEYLCRQMIWDNRTSKRSFIFTDEGIVTYFQDCSTVSNITLVARGTYSVDHGILNCYFTSVYWDGYRPDDKNLFPGWEYDKSCSKSFRVTVTASGAIAITDENNKTIYYDYDDDF